MSTVDCQMCRNEALVLASDPVFVAVAKRLPDARVHLCDGCRGVKVYGGDDDSTYAPVGYVPDPAAVQADQALLGTPGPTGTSRGGATAGISTPRIAPSTGGAPPRATGAGPTLSEGTPPPSSSPVPQGDGGDEANGYQESGASPTSWSGTQISQPPLPTDAPATVPVPPPAPPDVPPPLLPPDTAPQPPPAAAEPDEGPQSVPEADAKLAGVGSPPDTGDDTPDDDDGAESDPEADLAMSGQGGTGGGGAASSGRWGLLVYGRRQATDRRWVIALIVGLVLLLLLLAKRHTSAESTDPTGVQPEYA